MHGEVKGMDALEVVDVQAAFGEEEDPAEDEEGEVGSEPDFLKMNFRSNFAQKQLLLKMGSKTLVWMVKQWLPQPFVDESDNRLIARPLGKRWWSGLLKAKKVVAQEAEYSMAVWANGGNVVIKGGISEWWR